MDRLVSQGQIPDGITLAHGAGLLAKYKVDDLLRRNLRDMRAALDAARKAYPGIRGEVGLVFGRFTSSLC